MTLTTILWVDAIEPSLPFWVDALGFSLTVSVPHNEVLGFVILQKENIELMLQTWDSIAADMPAIGAETRGTSASLFLQVEDFEASVTSLKNYPVKVPDRTTFYGMREIGFTAPSGHLVVIAAQSPQTPSAS
ncbi:MAG: hypothetical protein NTW74_24500 [Acidobacteria bacterium]|nr:hypothetical protein [Acidobacteriota bacterium]